MNLTYQELFDFPFLCMYLQLFGQFTWELRHSITKTSKIRIPILMLLISQ